MSPLLLGAGDADGDAAPAGQSPAPPAGRALSVCDQAAGCSRITGRFRNTVTVTNATASVAPRTPTPHQTPLMLSSQPISRSIEKRPGPAAATRLNAQRRTVVAPCAGRPRGLPAA